MFDKTYGSGGTADFEKRDVYAGDIVTISPQIANTTDQPYTNMTVVTALPSQGDLVYSGDKPRGSQLTPTLVGPVTPLSG